MRRLPAFEDAEAKAILDALCRAKGIDPALVHELSEALAHHSGSNYKRGLAGEIDLLLNGFIREPDDQVA